MSTRRWMKRKKLAPKFGGYVDPVVIVGIEPPVKLLYPEGWTVVPLNPELEQRYATLFNTEELKTYIHCHQNQGVEGIHIYEHLKSHGMLDKCLGIEHLNAMLERGLDFFRRYYFGMRIPGWKSVIVGPNNRVCVPVLAEIEYRDAVVIVWENIKLCHFGEEEPALILP